MKKVLGFLFWGAVFVLTLLGIDQFLLRTPLTTPGLQQVRVFYLDFRQRLLQLPQNAPGKEASPKPSRAYPVQPRQKEPQPSAPVTYVYADESGNLQFVESLAEIPQRFRSAAKALQQ